MCDKMGCLLLQLQCDERGGKQCTPWPLVYWPKTTQYSLVLCTICPKLSAFEHNTRLALKAALYEWAGSPAPGETPGSGQKGQNPPRWLFAAGKCAKRHLWSTGREWAAQIGTLTHSCDMLTGCLWFGLWLYRVDWHIIDTEYTVSWHFLWK